MALSVHATRPSERRMRNGRRARRTRYSATRYDCDKKLQVDTTRGVRERLLAKAAFVFHDYRVNGRPILSSVDVRCLALATRELRDTLLRCQNASSSVVLHLRSSSSDRRDDADIGKDIERALFLNCDAEDLAIHLVSADVPTNLWKLAFPIKGAVVKHAMRQGKTTIAKELCDITAVYREHMKDVTFMTGAIESGDTSLAHHMHRKRWHHSVEDVRCVIIPNTAMLEWVCEHILYDDEIGRFSCSVNCYGRMGDAQKLVSLYDEALNMGMESYFLRNPFIRVVQTAAMGNHVQILRWVLSETDYDMYDELLLAEAYDCAVSQGHLEFAIELNSHVPFFLRERCALLDQLMAKAKNEKLMEWLQNLR